MSDERVQVISSEEESQTGKWRRKDVYVPMKEGTANDVDVERMGILMAETYGADYSGE